VTYVIDTDRMIRYAFIDADYRKRAEPKDIIAALEQLQ
ncbi:MAG: AhpC/TSA family protein, partial [bacterium]